MSRPPPAPYAGRIMISSVMDGVQQERAGIAAIIREAGQIPWYADDPSNEFRELSAKDASFAMARQCDLYLLVIFPRYGSQPLPDSIRSVTHDEFREAVQAHRRVVRAFILADAIREAEKDPLLRAFIEEVKGFESGRWTTIVPNEERLLIAVRSTLERWREDGEVGRKTYVEAVQTEYRRFLNPATGKEMDYSATVQLKLRAQLSPTHERPEWDAPEGEEVAGRRLGTGRDQGRATRDKAAERLRAPAQLDAMARGYRENANQHAAIQWLTAAARAGDPEALEQGLLLCGHLGWFLHITGQHLTARVALDVLLGLAVGRPPTRGRALASLAAGMVSTTTGEWQRSLAEWQSAYDDAEAVGDAEAAAEGAMGVGYCNLHLGRMEAAATALDEAVRRSTGVTDFILSLSMSLEGMRLFATGHLDQGMTKVTEACRVSQRIADYEIGGVAQSFLAQMTFAKGDAVRALALYDEALTMLQTVGDIPEIARVHSEMGWTALAGGDPRAALAAFRRAVLTHEQVGSPRGTGLALLGIAAVEAAEGRSERAVSIAAAAQALSERAGVVIDHPMDPGVVERIEALKASIPKGTLSGLVANASAMTPAEVLAMVGEQEPAAPVP